MTYRDDNEAAQARVLDLEDQLQQARKREIQNQIFIEQLQWQVEMLRRVTGDQGVYRSRARAIFVLGILAILVWGIFGPMAWALGNEELRRIDHGLVTNQDAQDRNLVAFGRTCGIVGTIFWMISMLFQVARF